MDMIVHRDWAWKCMLYVTENMDQFDMIWIYYIRKQIQLKVAHDHEPEQIHIMVTRWILQEETEY